jgi:putative spermidine/putrescine transport system substrate-binding protein
MMRINRRVLLVFMAVLSALILVLGACTTAEPTEEPIAPEAEVEEPEVEEPEVEAEGPPYPYEGELIISVWGGTTEEFLRDHIEPLFKEIYPNVEVVYDVGGSADRHNKLISQAGSPEIDLYIAAGEQILDAINKGLVSPLNPENVPNLADVYDWAKPFSEYGSAYGVIAYGIGYNPEYFGDDPPTSWDDLWREDIQGKLSVTAIGSSVQYAWIVEVAELAGGSESNVEPAWEKLCELTNPSQHFFFTQWLPSYEAGDIVLATDFDYYIHSIADGGVDIEYVIPEEGAWGIHQHMQVVAGTENQEMVERYINLMLSPEGQELVATVALNAPVRGDIEISDELAERLAVFGDSMDQVKWMDIEKAVPLRAEHTEKLNTEVAPCWGE